MTGTGTGAVDLSLMEPVFEKYQGQEGVLIPILQKAQSIYGYLPPEVLQSIADRLGIAPGKVYGVVTFYPQFHLEPRSRHVLRLCDGTVCHVKGAPDLQAAVREEFGVAPGEMSADGELTLEIAHCLGSCALAPVVVLDRRVMGRMRRERLIRTLAKMVGPKPD